MKTLVASLLLALFCSFAWAGDGPGGLPLPKDAVSQGNAPGGGGKIVVYGVPRSIAAAYAELKELLAKDGWKIDSEEKSPRGTVRMVVSKDKTIKVSIAGEGDKASFIITLP
jgi:hypothetical protein